MKEKMQQTMERKDSRYCIQGERRREREKLRKQDTERQRTLERARSQNKKQEMGIKQNIKGMEKTHFISSPSFLDFQTQTKASEAKFLLDHKIIFVSSIIKITIMA